MCISPLTINDNTFACGQCRECQIKKSMQWAYRCKVENHYAKSGVFLTLTYDESELPWIDTNEGTFATLHKPDFQKFMKRLRYYNNDKIRFFACGEYGPQTMRPHYHALIWNINRSSKKRLQEIWQKGHVKAGNIEEKSINYVTNYMMKKGVLNLPGTKPYFTLMSRNPGIGYQYFEANKERHNFHEDYRLMVPKPLEARPFMPRYYEDKIIPENMKEEVRLLKEKRSQEFMAQYEDSADPFGDILEYKRMKQQQAERRKKFFESKRKKL